LNFDIDVNCDFTTFITDQKDLFARPMRFRVAFDMLSKMKFNAEVKTNRHQTNAGKGDIEFEMVGDTQGRRDFSIYSKYKSALNSVNFDFGGIDDVCLKCKRRGIRVKAIGPRKRW
jgi:hypothetical protein